MPAGCVFVPRPLSVPFALPSIPVPSVSPEYRVKLNEGVEPKKVIKTTPVIRKESVLGSVEDKPVKKKKPYYRKKYNKPKPVEVVIPEPVKSDYSIKAFTIGLILGIVATFIVINLIK